MATDNPGLDPTDPLVARLRPRANPPELSAYDERPDLKRPGQRGVSFLPEAPVCGLLIVTAVAVVPVPAAAGVPVPVVLDGRNRHLAAGRD